MATEKIPSELLDELEEFLGKRIDITVDGGPNKAMILLQDLQDARQRQDHDPDQPLDHNGQPF